jgi:hypothetical protein
MALMKHINNDDDNVEAVSRKAILNAMKKTKE